MSPSAVQPALTTVQPSISTIHCLSLNKLILAYYIPRDSGSTSSPNRFPISASSLWTQRRSYPEPLLTLSLPSSLSPYPYPCHTSKIGPVSPLAATGSKITALVLGWAEDWVVRSGSRGFAVGG